MSENHIQTLQDASPVKMPFYRASPTIQKEIRKHVDDMLENDITEPSNSVGHYCYGLKALRRVEICS